MLKRILVSLGFCWMVTGCFAQSNQLDYFVQAALQNSPLLKDYQLKVQASRYDSLLILAAYKPQVTGNSFNNYAPVIKGWGYDDAITNGRNISALIGVNKQIQNKKLVNAQFQNLQIQNQQFVNTAKITKQDLQRTIIAQYITVYGDQQQLSFNQEVYQVLTREDIIFKKLTQGNVYKQADYLAFLVTMQQQDLLIKQLNMQVKNDYATLQYLSGVEDTLMAELQGPAISNSTLPAINNSVFYQQFYLDSLQLVNSKTLIDVSYTPKISVFADAGYNSSLAYRPYKNFGTSFGISATIPIYDGKQKELQYSKIELQEKSRQQYSHFFVNQYARQIAQYNQQLQATEQMISDINIQLRYSKSLVDVNSKLLEAGEVKVADYMLALNNYLNAKNLVTQNIISRLQIINQLNYWNQ
ncbi:MAG: TolC family protein [Ferruginibacter sp.]